MRRSRRISAIMHKLLIEHGLDGFTVLEARDLWLSLEDSGSDSTEARKRCIEQFLTLNRKTGYDMRALGETNVTFKRNNLKNNLTIEC